MLGVTLFGIFLTPVFFYAIQWVQEWRTGTKESGPAVPMAEVADARVDTGITTTPHDGAGGSAS
jgi:hypothetical protein